MTDSVNVIAGVAIPKIGVLANVAAPTFDTGIFYCVRDDGYARRNERRRIISRKGGIFKTLKNQHENV